MCGTTHKLKCSYAPSPQPIRGPRQSSGDIPGDLSAKSFKRGDRQEIADIADIARDRRDRKTWAWAQSAAPAKRKERNHPHISYITINGVPYPKKETTPRQ